MKRKSKILICTLIFVFLGAASFFSIKTISSKKIEAVEETNKEINKKTAGSLNQYFQNLVNNTIVFLDTASKIKNSNDSYDSYNKFLKYNPDVIFIGNNKGWYYYNTEYPFSSVLDDKINSWLLSMDTSSSIFDMRDFVNQFAIACVFKYGSGSNVKTGVAAVKTQTLSKMLNTSSSNSTLVVDHDSNLLLAPQVNIKKQTVPSAQKIIAQMDEKNLEEFSNYITINSNKFVINATKIQNGLYVITTVSENAMNKTVIITAMKIFLILFVLYILSILIILITHRKTEKQKSPVQQKTIQSDIKTDTNLSVILCSDILSYSSVKKMNAQEIINFSNEYLLKMTQCIEKTNGVINDTSSNKITASWTVIQDSKENSLAQNAINAVASALMMRIALFNYNKLLIQKGLKPVRTGCAVTSGVVISGKIGGSKNTPSLIGDAVQGADKIKELNKKYTTDIIITENIYKLIQNNIIAKQIPDAAYNSQRLYIVINLKNKKIPTDIKTLRQILTLELQ